MAKAACTFAGEEGVTGQLTFSQASDYYDVKALAVATVLVFKDAGIERTAGTK